MLRFVSRILAVVLALGVVLVSREAAAGGPRRTGLVTINCPVVGATVSVDGEEVGTIPLDPFELKLGSHKIRVVRAGLIAFEQQVQVNPGDDLKVVAIAKEARSLLTIETTEKGGEVLVDSKVVGALPLKEFVLAPGQHSVFIRKDGLMPYKDTVNIGPFRELVMNPILKRRDGTLVAAAPQGLGLGLDLDLAPVAPKNAGKPAASASAGLDLDLDIAPAPVAKNDPKAKNGKPAAVASNDLDLDLDFAAPPPPPPPAPTKVAANAPPPATKPAPAAKPATKPSAPLASAVKPPPTQSSFMADPIAAAEVEEEEEEEYDPTPLYKKKWVWASVAVATVVGVAVPIAMGKTGGYVERRNPDALCRDCVVGGAVLNYH